MLKYIKQYRFYIILFFFLIIPIMAIDTSTRTAKDYYFFDRAIVFMTSPIQVSIRWSLDNIISFFQRYIYLWNTHSNNIRLHEENRKLVSTIAELRESENENIRLKKLLGFQEKFNLESIVAKVIAKDVSTEFRAIRLNRGTNAGIKKNMPVVTYEGIVGRVLRVTPNSADVLTVLDLLSSVDAIVARSRARGVVEGMTDDLCQLKFMRRTDDVVVDDLLIASGLGGIFPKGVPIGNVSKVERKPYGISQKVELTPSVNFSKLEEVLILTNLNKTTTPATKPFENLVKKETEKSKGQATKEVKKP